MEWVETTGKTIDEALDRALDQLGVAEEDADYEVLDEPKAGLFGLIRGEARVRARVRPAEVRPKQERRRGRRNDRARGETAAATTGVADRSDDGGSHDDGDSDEAGDDSTAASAPSAADRGDRPSRRARGGRNARGAGRSQDDDAGSDRGDEGRSDAEPSDVDPEAVGRAAVEFVEGLVSAFGLEATVELEADGTDLEVRVSGSELGLLIGPGGRTLTAIQDLARVAAQRRLGDHETRLRVDVSGYRERRREALERFARSVAEQVIESGRARSMEPMSSADRKVIHDVVNDIDGVASRSEGDDPDRRVVVVPA